ncbi:MAG TPA: fimbria/pilus outer membrane usher protein [Ramlibacter sp.]|nr:fimbria/pilus outer membrane usher protein [Ramlibacter sp.]
MLAAQPTRPDAPTASPLADRIIPMEAVVNGSKVGTWPFVERQGQLYVGKDAFEDWRVQLPPGPQSISVRGVDYWPLAAVPGYNFKVNYSSQIVEIAFAPEAFYTTKFNSELASIKTSPVLPSVFVNYDLNLESSKAREQPFQNSLGALLELGASNDWGVLTSSHVGRNLNHSSAGDSGWVRLESTFTRHMPESSRTLRVGDAATRPGLWGSSVYFGGVQFGSNYALTPGFITQPVPLVSGVSAAPSTVQLYVNDVLRKTTDVPAGPFVIDNLTGVTGTGQARLVVKDVLGREVVIVQPYFTSTQLLARGLNDWSVETGAVRRNLGVESYDYGSKFLNVTWRRGLNDLITVEGRGEFTRSTKTTGLGLVSALPFDLLGKAALVRSTDVDVGSGHKWVLGLERQWTDTSVYLEAQGASRQYVELGKPAAILPSRTEWATSFSHQFGSMGTLGISLAGVRNFDTTSVTTLGVNYSIRLSKQTTLMANFTRALSNTPSTLFGLSISVSLDGNRQMQASASTTKGGTDFYTTVTSAPNPETDLGWRALAGRFQHEAHAEAGIDYGSRFGRFSSDLSTSGSQTTIRSGFTGGLVWAAGLPFLTKRVDQSFAVAEVKGYPDIGIGLGSNPTTRTDASGIALVPFLSPYQSNQIRLNASDLPISAEIESIERTVVPRWRSGVKVDFPVRAGKAALLKIQFDDGEPAPAGAVVRIEGDNEEFYVARRGEAYVTALQPENVLTLTWKQQSCRFPVQISPAANDDVIRLGPLRCGGVKR